MAKFSKLSDERLNTCHPLLQTLMREVVKGYDCAIICGHRGEKEQQAAVEGGFSKVTFPNSRHNSMPSQAADVMPFPIDWNDTSRIYHFAGYVKATSDRLGIKVRWGGDWNSDLKFRDEKFKDLPHWELVL